jgi:hypothetical protein
MRIKTHQHEVIFFRNNILVTRPRDPHPPLPFSTILALHLRAGKSGTDIYIRINRDGTHRYFIRDWSEEQDICMSVSEEFAVRLLRGLAAMPETVTYIESGNIRRVLPGYYEEL